MEMFVKLLTATTFGIPNWLYLIFGIIFSIFSNTNKSKIKIPSRKLDWIFLTFNLFLILWNATLTTYLTKITIDGNNMNELDLSGLVGLAQGFFVFTIIIFGVLVGDVLFVYGQALINRIKNRKHPELITSTKLQGDKQKFDDIRNFIKEKRQEMNQTHDFLKGINEDKPKE